MTTAFRGFRFGALLALFTLLFTPITPLKAQGPDVDIGFFERESATSGSLFQWRAGSRSLRR